MRKEKVISNYTSQTDSELSILAGKVVGSLTDNENFTDLNPALEDLKELTDDYRAKLEVASRGGSVFEVSLKNESRNALIGGLRILAHHVNMIADGSLAILSSTGLILTKQPSAVQVPGVSERIMVKHGHLKGQVRLDFTPVKNTWAYEIEAGKADVDGVLNWENQYQSTSSRGVVLGPFISGTEVYVRVRARNGKGQGDWSAHASIVVH